MLDGRQMETNILCIHFAIRHTNMRPLRMYLQHASKCGLSHSLWLFANPNGFGWTAVPSCSAINAVDKTWATVRNRVETLDLPTSAIMFLIHSGIAKVSAKTCSTPMSPNSSTPDQKHFQIWPIHIAEWIANSFIQKMETIWPVAPPASSQTLTASLAGTG